MMTSRQRFLAAAHGQATDRRPIWLMRQAGRSLPEYRALKERYTFLQLAQNPELATEVTLQPIRRFGFDAAILFSDILVIPEAMGQPYSFREQGGIGMDFAIESEQDIDRLETNAIRERLGYVAQTLKLLRAELDDERALLGFGGSPWTLATYMIEGGSSKNYLRSRRFFYENPQAFDRLMEKLCSALIDYFTMQIESGADAIQIFDSWGGVLPGLDYERGSLQWMRRIIDALPKDFPIILFAKGCAQHTPALAQSGARVLGYDWTAPLADYARSLPQGIAVQGNLDPWLLNTTPDVVEQSATRLLESMRDIPGYIFNLGHGVDKDAKLECIERLVHTVHNFK